MNSLRINLIFSSIFLAACQTTPAVGSAKVYPAYASKSAALAVAAGNFGATPLALLVEAELAQMETLSCKAGVAEIQTQEHGRVWLPADSLPESLKAASKCSG